MIFILFVTVFGVSSAVPSETLSVTNGGDKGVWGQPEYCANNTYAVGYDMKIEGRQGWFGDDTALNGIKLICRSPDEYSSIKNHVTSKVGSWGRWVGEAYCNSGAGKRDFLTAFSLQVERNGVADGTSANYVKFECRDLERFKTSYEMSKAPGHGKWGTYGPWSSQCPAGKAICGIKTRIEPPRGRRADDTALNDVVFYCCD
ncbi:vitelline membrane outer layer protein 1 homolog [Mercenaria mercenaria]|uniref:vitelline membrane outer layer protein 1 homolog n=1 Tax=Mercenaria mercenaria TaxID=6596 RepID=UPI00234F37E2|nr:vitelline membrane outer layer protein 1 homolog [Mercenaria mercenaria]